MGLSWDEYGMALSRVVARKSKDPSTQVGAVIMDRLNRVVSVGYNGLPRGVADTKDVLTNREMKYSTVIHAEENALLFAQRDLTGCTVYVTLPPCSRCAAKIVQVGIKRIVAGRPTEEQELRWGQGWELARWLYRQPGVGIDYVEVEDTMGVHNVGE
jgi:dCMP deaminase